MEHSGLLHPEFGLLCPPPRLRRELRIAMTSLLLGGIAGALCVSGVIAFRHSDSAPLESAEASSAAPASRDVKLGAAADSSAPRPELAAGPAAAPAPAEASAKTPAQTSTETSALSAALAPKARVMRIPRTLDSPAIARLPLGRSEPHAAASPPAADNPPPATPPAVNAAVAAGAAAEKPVAPYGASERTASTPSPKKAQKTARKAGPRRNESGNDYFGRDDRLDDWSARAATVNDARSAVGRAYAREGSSSIRGFWDWSR